MAVDSASSVGATGITPTYTRDTSNDTRDMTIDTQTFLTMLVTQLKYQDPLSPQDNSQFVSQMAQMSSLSAMKDMSNSLANSQAYDMIGKEIYAEVTDKTTHVTKQYTGVVDGVVIKDGVPYVVVDNTAIAVTDVLQVSPDESNDTVSTEMKKTQAFDMLGKQIYAEVTDEETDEETTYSGIVESVVIKDGIPYVVVGGVNISVDDVLKVSPAPSESNTAAETPASSTDTTQTA
jgi:flagellar basal-body rod modification protein FlgD